MKKRIFILILALNILSIRLFSNDTYIEVSGGSLSLTELSKNDDIQMVSEEITITLFDEYYETSVIFNFYNHGIEQEILVGFPQWSRGTQNKDNFINFSATLNGENQEFQEILVDNPEPLERYLIIYKWYTRNIKFESNGYTQTSVNYKVPYGSYGNGAEYLYGTGSSWSRSIETMNVKLVNKSQRWINEVSFDTEDERIEIENINNEIIIKLTDVKPNPSDLIILTVNKIPRGLVTNRRIDPERWWYYGSIKLDKEDVNLLTSSQLRLLRNLLFAAKGHIFRSEDINMWLQKYCSDWYSPERKVSINELNEIEKYNLELIQSVEMQRDSN